MNNWFAILKYDDGRLIISEQVCAKDADDKAAELMREHGQENVVIYLAEIKFTIRG